MESYKILILIFLKILYFCSCTYSQELDIAKYKIHYKHIWQFDTLQRTDIREDLIILQVGHSISKSYSYYTFKSDSLFSTIDGNKVFRESLSHAIREARTNGIRPKFTYTRRMGAKVYKDYRNGEVTITDNINSNYYQYSDILNSQEWVISDSTKLYMGYKCQQALCNFRGRMWEAWFTIEIPISDGPWIFSGLPGLIMEVYDKMDHYRFSIVGIEQVQDEPIVFSPVVLGYRSYGIYEETTRLAFLRALARYLGNSAAIMNAELGRETFDETTPNSKPHDLIERDYR